MADTFGDKCRHHPLTSIVIRACFPVEGHGDFFSTSDPLHELVVFFTTPTFPCIGAIAENALIPGT
jgi:hypothetical protein